MTVQASRKKTYWNTPTDVLVRNSYPSRQRTQQLRMSVGECINRVYTWKVDVLTMASESTYTNAQWPQHWGDTAPLL